MSRLPVGLRLDTETGVGKLLRETVTRMNESAPPKARMDEATLLQELLEAPTVVSAIETELESYTTDPVEARARALEAEADREEARAAELASERRAAAERLRNPPEPEPADEDETTA